jgi:hypothetical protein
MEIVYFSETLVSTYESTWRRNPEQQHRLHRRDNLKCHIVDNTVLSNSSPFAVSKIVNNGEMNTLDRTSERLGRVVETPASCSGDPGFKSHPGYPD